MEALRSLISGDLPPVGNRITISGSSENPLPSIPGYYATWLDSGTSSLALALLDAKQRCPHVSRPEVIIPAYCCPDLIAAAEYAGVIPVIVDISPSDMAFPIEELNININQNTIAIIAMTFLGIRENNLRLMDFLKSEHPNIVLIEDNAQWFPDLQGNDFFTADYLIFSFGRGKPLSLLGGGALFSKKALNIKLEEPPQPKATRVQQLKYLAYNCLLQPNLYWFANHNPVLKLGETRFHPLNKVELMDGYRMRILGDNAVSYQNRSRDLEQIYKDMLERIPLPLGYPALFTSRHHRLLRYPLLCQNQQQRDFLLRQLNTLGLGASALYKLPLIAMKDLPDNIRFTSSCEQAADFAGRLLTLPLHSGVKSHHLQKIEGILKNLGH